MQKLRSKVVVIALGLVYSIYPILFNGCKRAESHTETSVFEVPCNYNKLVNYISCGSITLYPVKSDKGEYKFFSSQPNALFLDILKDTTIEVDTRASKLEVELIRLELDSLKEEFRKHKEEQETRDLLKKMLEVPPSNPFFP